MLFIEAAKPLRWIIVPGSRALATVATDPAERGGPCVDDAPPL